MPHYAVRITHSYEVAKPIVHLWAMKCEKSWHTSTSANVQVKSHSSTACEYKRR